MGREGNFQRRSFLTGLAGLFLKLPVLKISAATQTAPAARAAGTRVLLDQDMNERHSTVWLAIVRGRRGQYGMVTLTAVSNGLNIAVVPLAPL